MTWEERENLPDRVEVSDTLARTNVLDFFRECFGYTFRQFENIKFLFRCQQYSTLFVNTQVNQIYEFMDEHELDKNYMTFTLEEYLDYFYPGYSDYYVHEMYGKTPYYIEDTPYEQHREKCIQYVLNVITNFASLSWDYSAYDNRKMEIITDANLREYIIFEEPITKIWMYVSLKPSQRNRIEFGVCDTHYCQDCHYQKFDEYVLHEFIEKLHEELQTGEADEELYIIRDSPEAYKEDYIEKLNHTFYIKHIMDGKVKVEVLDVKSMIPTCYGGEDDDEDYDYQYEEDIIEFEKRNSTEDEVNYLKSFEIRYNHHESDYNIIISDNRHSFYMFYISGMGFENDNFPMYWGIVWNRKPMLLGVFREIKTVTDGLYVKWKFCSLEELNGDSYSSIEPDDVTKTMLKEALTATYGSISGNRNVTETEFDF